MKIKLLFFILVCSLSIAYSGENSNKWSHTRPIAKTKASPTRTAILIIAAPLFDNSPIHQRWCLGYETWKHYMNSHPDVDCYFIIPTQPRKDGSPDVWIEGNIIYVGDIYYELYRNDRILYKTIKALELLLPHYTHFIRTNVNTFCNLENVHKFMSSHHASFYSAFFWQGEWYTLGYGILFTKTTAHHIVTEYERLKDHPFLYPDRYPDDCLLTALATGIWPLSPENPFKRYEGLPYNGKQFISEESLKSRALTPHGVFLDKIPSLEEALALCEAAPNTAALYRIKDGLTLDELKILYNYLLETIYGVSLTTENGGG